MEETLFTFLMVFMMVLLFCIRYVVPFVIAIIGALLIKKKNKKVFGGILLTLGIMVEVISIVVKVYSFM